MSKLPAPPAHLAGYVEVLGVDGTVELLLRLGGSEVYFAHNPKGRGALAKLVGVEKAAALAEQSVSLSRRIPTGKPWLAKVLSSKGLTVAEIARRLHVTDVTVRSYLKQGGDGPPADSRQLPLF
ncbi:MAG: helix-turn-helix domain-containing protein [Jannaschia sp.]